MRQNPFRSLVRILACSGLLGGVILLGACSSDDPVPFCQNCEIWEQLSVGVGRFPDPHPDVADFYVYSTITKTPGADDANRESDEDIWLLYDAGNPDVGALANRVWQITADEMGMSGDNFSPRWSPSGTQVLFTHIQQNGIFEAWRVDVSLPANPLDPSAQPVIGVPERLATTARDPEWVSDTEILFTRASKLYRLDLITRGDPVPAQITFNPPIYASSEEFLDRHPDVSPDGGAAFSTLGREPVGTISVEAYEDFGGTLVETDAYLFLQAPGAVGTYPLFEGPDTLRTPTTLLSLPTSEEDDLNDFVVGVRLDSRFLDSTRVSYCDTTLSATLDLLPGEEAAVSFVFRPARGSLRVTTQRPLTNVFWERQDGAISSDDFPGSTLLDNAGDFLTWDCLLSWSLDGMGVPQEGVLESYIITGTSEGMVDQDTVVVMPDSLVQVNLFGAPDPAPRSGQGRFFSARSEPPAARGGSVHTGLRAEGDLGTIWRVSLADAGIPDLTEVAGSPGVIQNPAVSNDLGGGVRYIAYVSDESGLWELYVQRLTNWVRDGTPQRVPTPGAIDNLSCTRDAFYPRFVEGTSASELLIVCSLADCPDNGFEDLGFDEDPWALGELRLWRVSYVPN